jgi:hypothetical protein
MKNGKFFTTGSHLCHFPSSLAFPDHLFPFLEPFPSDEVGDAIQVGEHDRVLLGHEHGFGLEELGLGFDLKSLVLASASKSLGFASDSKAFVLASTSKTLALAMASSLATDHSWISTDHSCRSNFG